MNESHTTLNLFVDHVQERASSVWASPFHTETVPFPSKELAAVEALSRLSNVCRNAVIVELVRLALGVMLKNSDKKQRLLFEAERDIVLGKLIEQARNSELGS